MTQQAEYAYAIKHPDGPCLELATVSTYRKHLVELIKDSHEKQWYKDAKVVKVRIEEI